jgi:hypothetical protein
MGCDPRSVADRFFGKIVDVLFRYRRDDLTTNEDRKAALEKDEHPHWRTVERWFSGDVDVPNAVRLEALGGMLGDRAEMMLRAARLACVLRRSLREWIGEDSAAEWAARWRTWGALRHRLCSTLRSWPYSPPASWELDGPPGPMS